MALLESKAALIEAINADIVNNGKKGITGDTLNLILNSIVELMETGSGGGGNVYNVPIGMLMASETSPYTFTTEEADAFKAAVANIADTTFGIYMAQDTIDMRMVFPSVQSQDVNGAVVYTMTALMPLDSEFMPMVCEVSILPDGSVMGYMSV